MLLLSLSPLANAQTSVPEVSPIFHFGIRWGDGLTLEYHGLVSGTAFGLDQRLVDRLSANPASLELVKRYQTVDAWGNGLLWGGMGLAVASVFMANAGVSNAGPVVVTIALTGLVGALVGNLVQTAAQQLAARAANAYN
ncbi:MAG: hypothetical protein HKM05_05950 [Spirochaetales bacterium]|nr:hypothetical protein [Spirochaetales bacterium]